MKKSSHKHPEPAHAVSVLQRPIPLSFSRLITDSPHLDFIQVEGLRGPAAVGTTTSLPTFRIVSSHENPIVERFHPAAVASASVQP